MSTGCPAGGHQGDGGREGTRVWKWQREWQGGEGQ